MTTEMLVRQLSSFRKKSEMEDWVNSYTGPAIKGTVSRVDITTLSEHLKANRRHDAAALSIALAMIDANGLVMSLRRAGLLRASRYGFNAGSPREIVDILLRLNGTIGLCHEQAEYLQSIKALHSLSAGAGQLHEGIVVRLRTRRGTALKSFLVMANQVFTNGWSQDPFSPSSCLEHFSAEQISEAISRLIHVHREAFGIKATDWMFADPQAINPLNYTYKRDLLDALRLNEFIKAETMIDGLPYKAEFNPTGVVIRSIDPDIEKSVRLGYVHMEMQMHSRRQAIEAYWEQSEKPASFEKVCEVYFKEGLEQYVLHKLEPVARLTFGFPKDAAFFQPLAEERYFREDLLSLVQLGIESYSSPSLEPFNVAPGVRSIDLFKINRIFELLTYVMSSALAKIENKSEKEMLTLHSVIPKMTRDSFLNILQSVLTPEQAEKVLSLLTLDETREYIDLQYTPFISVDGGIIVAPALVARSNLVRNIACANNLQEMRIGDHDPMQRAVVQALLEAEFLVEEEVSVSINGTERDTDIVAYRDGVLYLFECKNAYHPCNVHEMRNSFDHIKKAGRQLTLRKEWFAQPMHQARLWQKMNWQVPFTTSIRTCVLIANRVFTGATIDGHPIRQGHEFINVVLRGEVRSPDTIYLIWDGEQFATQDLDRYLSPAGLVADQFAALKPIQKCYQLQSKSLAFDSWVLDSELLHTITASRYRTRPYQKD